MIPAILHPQESPPGYAPSRVSMAEGGSLTGLNAGGLRNAIYVLLAHPFDSSISRSASAVPPPTVIAPPAFSGYATVLGGEATLAVASRNLRTAANDTPANTRIPGRLGAESGDGAYSLTVGLGSTSDPIGGASVQVGSLAVLNSDGEYDAFADLSWGGRLAEIKAISAKTDSIRDAALVFSGTVVDAPVSETTLTLALTSNLSALDAPMTGQRRYLGTGGAEGPASLTGTIVPEIFGVCRQVGMVLLDSAKQIWQLCRQASAISSVKNRGLDVSDSSTDYASYAAMSAASAPSAGYYATCKAEGLIRFGSDVSTPTANVTGPVAAGTTPSSIIQWLVANRAASSVSTMAFNAAYLTRLSTSRNFNVGIYINEADSVLSVCTTLMRSIGGYITTNRAGEITLGVFTVESSPVNYIREPDVGFGGVAQEGSIRPVKSVIVNYQKRIASLSGNDISEAVTQEVRASMVAPHLTLAPITTTTVHRDAQDFIFDTLLDSVDDASTVGNALLTFLQYRRMLSIPLSAMGFDFWIGDSWNLVYNRLGFEAGRRVWVTGIDESANGTHRVIVRYNPEEVPLSLVEIKDSSNNILLTSTGSIIVRA